MNQIQNKNVSSTAAQDLSPSQTLDKDISYRILRENVEVNRLSFGNNELVKSICAFHESNVSEEDILDLSTNSGAKKETQTLIISTHSVDNMDDNAVDKRSVFESKSQIVRDEMQPYFKTPEFKRNKNKSKRTRDTTPCSTVDDLLVKLQKKEEEKNQKEAEVLGRKQMRVKNKILKEQETNIKKALKQTMTNLMTEKQTVSLKIKQLKSSIKSAPKENNNNFDQQLIVLNERLDEIEQAIAEEKLKAVQSKIKIKKERI
ncbi:hypothetical protein TKK_0014281 [Trichogramma kaykai]|uniref:Uncharacterized protein n=1 Tax=Trichogramma kaykai TaxID=54128 RepID=A0ABD2WE66_9HYME